MKKIISIQEKKYRRCLRAAQILNDCLEEGEGCDSRLLEHLIPDSWAYLGESINGTAHREHIVPLCFIRNETTKYLKEGRAIEDVAKFMCDHYHIILISKEEANYMDHTLKLKFGMPKDWEVGHDVTARIIKANIKFLAKSPEFKKAS